jgi:hypothetical protein
MSVVLLPDSRITSMVMGNDIFAYAQAYDGDIYQFVGAVENAVTYYGQRKKSGVIIERMRGSKPGPNAPKLFTPLAAVSFVDELNKPMAEKVRSPDIFSRHCCLTLSGFSSSFI